MNDAKNDNLNDPPGFPGKILKVGDFARTCNDVILVEKGAKIYPIPNIFVGKCVLSFYAVEVVSIHQNMNCGSNKQPQCWTFPARTKSSALKHRVSIVKGAFNLLCNW